jgi:rSAM/selenodomain-associated transferase 2
MCRGQAAPLRAEFVDRLSIVIPTLNEAAVIVGTLEALRPLRAAGHEIIVVDAGDDATAVLAAPLADRVVRSPRGRAVQMNRGAAAARSEVLLFLHVDTLLPDGAAALVLDGLKRSGRRWGRFDVRLSGRHPLLRLVERAMSIRSRLTGIATGDQAIFVERALFERVGGFPEIALMEDIALSKRLKREEGRPLCLNARVVTSSRRWERDGVLRTILLMWWLRLRYFLGTDPTDLARAYVGPSRH